MLAQLNSAKAHYVLRVVNQLWVQQDLPLRQDYVTLLASDFQSGLQKMDFQGDPEESREVINDWVARQTEDLIQDLIPDGVLTPYTQLVFTNAIYFHADHPFLFLIRQQATGTILFMGRVTDPAST